MVSVYFVEFNKSRAALGTQSKAITEARGAWKARSIRI